MSKKSKVALITGASRGIGFRVAEALAEDGYKLALIARSGLALEKLADKLIARGLSKSAVIAYPLDVRDHYGVQEMVAAVKTQFGHIDLLFNNAGVEQFGTMDVSIEDFDKTIGINLRGAFSVLQAIVPIMEGQGHGYIINVSSRAGKIGFSDYGVYAASKFGLVGLNEALYNYLSFKGIKVTALCPSWVDTDMAKESGLKKDEMISKDDIVSTLRWLLSLSPAAVVKEVLIECSKSTA